MLCLPCRSELALFRWNLIKKWEIFLQLLYIYCLSGFRFIILRAFCLVSAILTFKASKVKTSEQYSFSNLVYNWSTLNKHKVSLASCYINSGCFLFNGLSWGLKTFNTWSVSTIVIVMRFDVWWKGYCFPRGLRGGYDFPNFRSFWQLLKTFWKVLLHKIHFSEFVFFKDLNRGANFCLWFYDNIVFIKRTTPKCNACLQTVI